MRSKPASPDSNSNSVSQGIGASQDSGARDIFPAVPVIKSGRVVALAFAALLVLQAVLVHDGLSSLKTIGTAFRMVVDQAVPAEQHARNMVNAAQNRIILMLRMLAEPDPFERDEDARAFEMEGLMFGRSRDALAGMALDAAAQQKFQIVQDLAVDLSQRQRRVVEALLGGDDEQARHILTTERVLERQRKLVEALNAFSVWQQSVATEAQAKALEQETRARTLLLGLGAGVFFLGVLIGVVVTHLIARAEEVLKAERVRAEEAAHTDPLTGLLNRRGFERVRVRWRDQGQPDQHHALLLIDLDRFKPVNDEAGHDAGDALLKRLAVLIRDHTRPHDLVARLGGDEFGVLLAGLSAEEAEVIAERIRRAINGFTFDWNGQMFRIGASIGVASFPARLSEDVWRKTMKRADEACYAAKHHGRNRVVVADVIEPEGV